MDPRNTFLTWPKSIRSQFDIEFPDHPVSLFPSFVFWDCMLPSYADDAAVGHGVVLATPHDLAQLIMYDSLEIVSEGSDARFTPPEEQVQLEMLLEPALDPDRAGHEIGNVASNGQYAFSGHVMHAPLLKYEPRLHAVHVALSLTIPKRMSGCPKYVRG
jgi:hypothetical protein